MTNIPEYHYNIILLDLNNDLSDKEIEEVVDEIGVSTDIDDLDVSIMKQKYITENQDMVLKNDIKPGKYPYFLITRGLNEKMNQIRDEYKQKHRIKNMLKMISPTELHYATQDYMLNFEHTVFHTDNINEVINYFEGIQ
ncbi:hypothetical protein EV207_10380 [Scopulibacillus darangshiensis]|uniref:Uncharacterized protein n=1 Tax=Scopulibacillus darangshiensis TaxID=442528 RepID=A0A4R2P8M3_9BACL|nr:hypothetical protein [Scopulibacillus darangshiensis]TCP31197.1 hypothetical protein EV207_10380 [Scopulibacillus darangshiensis]